MIHVVTDSTANLSPELVSEYNLSVVPLKVQFGSETFREGELAPATFFQRLASATSQPTTSQPAPGEFEEVYGPLLSGGDEVISLHLSSDLSGTFNSARTASLSVDTDRVAVVDTRTVSAGLGLLVLAAAEMARAGHTRQAIVDEIERLAPQSHLVLTLDTLEYLKRGGRIGGAAAFVGGLLRIKPIIVVKNGKLEAGERARSRRKALEILTENQRTRFGQQPVWVGIAAALADDAEELTRMVRGALNVERLVHCEIGPVVATHTGPNTLGVVVMPAPKMD